MTANYDKDGKLTYYDYSNFPLVQYEIAARRDHKDPRGPDNVSVHHKIRYSVAGGQQGLDDIASARKKPWLYVHGGPGGGFSPDDHTLVDPEEYVPIMVTQRGAAGSGREGIMNDVSVRLFMADFLDVLAEHSIEKADWAGGSWGTTLVLMFFLEHPGAFTKKPTLRGLWLPSQTDLKFGYSRLNQNFPNGEEEQEKFFGFIAEQQAFLESHGIWDEVKLQSEDDLPFRAYGFMINGNHENEELREKAARAIWQWELISAKANPTPEDLQHIKEDAANTTQALGFAATICHFAENNFFLDIGEDYTDSEIWQRREEIAASKLENGDLVHGSLDTLCRPEIAEKWGKDSGYRLHLVKAGHSRTEPNIRDMLIRVDNRHDRSISTSG
jgi:proline iminopeptidase